jgi:hypothetical protein
MKKIIIGLCVIIVIQALCIVNVKSDIYQNTIYIEALERYTKVSIYKKDAQLYLMNSYWNNPEIHKLLADSCKADCIKYENDK